MSDGTRIPGDPEVRVWELPSGLLRRKIVLGGEPQCLALSRGGETLAVGWASDIELWRVNTGQRIRRWRAHSVGVICLEFSPDGALLASGGYDNLAKAWVSATGELRHTLVGHIGGVGACAFSPDGKTIATSGIDSTLRLWSATVGRELFHITQDTIPMRIGFSPDGRYLAASSLGGSVVVCDAQTPTVVSKTVGAARGRF